MNLFRRKAAHEAPVAPERPVNGHLVVEHGAGADAPRDTQVNFKATAETAALIAAIAKARGMSRAELLEDMVAGQVEICEKAGIQLKL
jgi:predicted RNA-binding Zn ribbon-like protein